MLNSWSAVGRMVADPELRYTPSGHAVATFRLAVDNGKGPDGEKQTLFATIVCWEQQAEMVANNGKKGRLVSVNGRWMQRSYDAKDGGKRTVYEVQAVPFGVHLLDKADQIGGHGKAGSMGNEPNFRDDSDVPF